MASSSSTEIAVLRRWDAESAIPRLVRGGGIAGMRAVGLVLRLINLAVIARALGIAGFGDVTTALALGAVLALPMSLGFKTSVFAHVPMYQSAGDREKIADFRTFAARQIRQASLVWWVAGTSASVVLLVFDKSWWWLPAVALMVATGETLLNLEAEIVRARDRPMIAMVAVGVLPHVLLTVIVGLLWLVSAPAPAFVIAFAAASGLSLLALRSVHDLPRAAGYDARDKTRWASYRVPLVLAGAGQLVLSQSPIILLRMFASAGEAGGYSAAYRLAALITLVPGAMASAATPGITMHLGGERFGRAAKELKQLLSFNVPLVAAITALLWLFPTQLLAAFGGDFEAYSDEVRILAIGLGVGAAVGPVSTLLITFERKAWVMAAYVVTSVLFVAAMVISAPVSAHSTAYLVALAMGAQNIVQAVLLRVAWTSRSHAP